jgi:hypothetical protein
MRIVSRHVIPGVLAVTAALLIGAYASNPPIHRETNPAATFGSYKTFGFYSPLAIDTLVTNMMAPVPEAVK